MKLVLPPGWYKSHPELSEPMEFDAGTPEKEEDQISSDTKTNQP